jgi:hypothetical protein
VKKLIFIVLLQIGIYTCQAQEVTTVKNRPNNFYTERYQVLKSNPSVRHGLYQALFKRNTAVASGNYTNGKRTGIWHFYNEDGAIMQNFDYDSKTILFEAPEDSSSDLRYVVDSKLRDTDKTTKPFKVGGRYFGYIPFLAAFAFQYDMVDFYSNLFEVEVQLLITPLGRLADYKVHVFSAKYKYDLTTTMSLSLFKEEDKQFIPATVNGEPVVCRILIKCYLTNDGFLDFM